MKYSFCLLLFLGCSLLCHSQTTAPKAPGTKQLAAEKARAAKGNADAMLHMGLYYYYGSGVAKNYVTAGQWLQKAAKKGNVNAMELLGEMYEEGEGMKKDIE